MHILSREEKLEYFASDERARYLLLEDLAKKDGQAPASIEDHIDRVLVKRISPTVYGISIDKDETGAFVNIKEVELKNPPKQV